MSLFQGENNIYLYKDGTQSSVLISEVSLFQGENNMYLYKDGTQSSVLINQGVLISEVSFKRGSTVVASNITQLSTGSQLYS